MLGTLSPFRVGLHASVLSAMLATPAHADVLFPMLFATPLFLIGALIPAIVIEGLAILARLDLGILPALAVSAANNVVSTLIGVPLAFFLAGFLVDKAEASIRRKPSKLMKSFVAPIVMGSGIWYDGSEPVRNKWIGWGAQILLVVFFIPFFFLSWWVESFVAGWILEGVPGDHISQAVMIANLVTYVLLGAIVLSAGLEEYDESRKELAEMTSEDTKEDTGKD